MFRRIEPEDIQYSLRNLADAAADLYSQFCQAQEKVAELEATNEELLDKLHEAEQRVAELEQVNAELEES